LRFHLHPTTRATAAADGMSATLILSNGDSWKFAADGLPVGVEASISFAGAGGPRAALQIVVQSTVETPAINWSLEKL
jgi:uncharacterized heparinase superfamily protein